MRTQRDAREAKRRRSWHNMADDMFLSNLTSKREEALFVPVVIIVC